MILLYSFSQGNTLTNSDTRGLEMSFAKKMAVGIVAIVVVLNALVAPSASATGNPNQLDQGDLTLRCKTQYGQQGWQAYLYGSTAVDWKCFYNDGWPWSVWTSERRSVDIGGYCWSLWNKSAQYRNYNDPNSWYCA